MEARVRLVAAAGADAVIVQAGPMRLPPVGAAVPSHAGRARLGHEDSGCLVAFRACGGTHRLGRMVGRRSARGQARQPGEPAVGGSRPSSARPRHRQVPGDPAVVALARRARPGHPRQHACGSTRVTQDRARVKDRVRAYGVRAAGPGCGGARAARRAWPRHPWQHADEHHERGRRRVCAPGGRRARRGRPRA